MQCSENGAMTFSRITLSRIDCHGGDAKLPINYPGQRNRAKTLVELDILLSVVLLNVVAVKKKLVTSYQKKMCCS
jgi:hypothetical protein